MNDRWRGLEVGFAGIVALFTIVLAIVSYWQWTVATDTANAAKENADAAIAGVRAWLAVIDFDVPDLKDINTVEFKIKVKNVGKTPSTGVTITNDFVYRHEDELATEMGRCPSLMPRTFGSMGADQSYAYPVAVNGSYDGSPIAALAGHKARLFIHRCLQYGIIPGNRFGNTEFCSELYITDNKTLTRPCSGMAQIMK
jgi:hypothetical protein